ncbi:MAG: sulfotransferase family 2 domain-containing protein, partial [Planctomycetes bacterium]|nr:sulfotransferase family 2 domain-containing protein [Planctomycetota bacterium]
HTCAQRECTFKVKSSLALNILEDHNFFKFAFVRNPWSRLVAGYLDKFVQYYAEIAGDLAELIAHVQEKSRSDLDLNKGVTFRQFVERVAGSRDMELDEHWRPQSCFVAYHKFDFIGKFENFQADVKYVNQQLGIELNLGHGSNSVGYASNIASGAGNSYFDNCYADELRKIKEDCGGFPDYKRFYPPDLRELVANKYQKDIEIFGYNFE